MLYTAGPLEITFNIYFSMTSIICICIHSLGMIYCLIKLKELSLANNEDTVEPVVPLKKLVDLSVPNQLQTVATVHRQDEVKTTLI